MKLASHLAMGKFLALSLLAGSCIAQVHATLRLASPATQYQQGEPINLELTITTDPSASQFQMLTQTGTRWELEPTEQFRLTPADGAIDPLAAYTDYIDNQRRYRPTIGLNIQELMGHPSPASPVTLIPIQLTDWFRFTKPGHYKLSVLTTRLVGTPLETNTIEFDILPAKPTWLTDQANLARSLALNYEAQLLDLMASPAKPVSNRCAPCSQIQTTPSRQAS